MTRDELGAVCTHGQLERVCPLCELTAERDALADLLREVLHHGYGPNWAERARAALGLRT